MNVYLSIGAMIYGFSNFTLDTRRDELLRDGRRVDLTPMPFAILKYLIEHCGRVVKKQELQHNVWRDIVVSGSALHSRISELRSALGQERSETRPIRTVHRVGYCFECDVVVSEDEVAEARKTALPSSPPAAASVASDSVFEPFVGRHQVLDQLKLALEQADSGESGFFLLEGDAGIGKTRTAAELSAYARRKGHRVYVGRCLEQQGAPAFLPWNSVLRGATEKITPESLTPADRRSLAQLSLIVPDLADRPDESFERSDFDVPAKFRLFQTITRLLISASKTCTCLIVLDDLHWADTASLELAIYLASQLMEGRLLIVGTLRDTELYLEHPNRKLLHALLDIRACQRIKLVGLQQQEVGQYLAQVFRNNVPESLVTALFERTSGNPFFVREAVRLLIAKGKWSKLADIRPQDIELPGAVLDIVRSRLNKIDPESRKLLEFASVIGRKFDLSVLQYLSDRKPGEVLTGLEAAEQSGLIRRLEEVGQYEFSHELITEVLYRGLSSGTRARYHRRTGEVLEQYPRSELGTNELAYHFYHALPEGQYEKAFRYEMEAASRATDLLAHREAATHLHRALRTLDFHPEPDPSMQCDLLSAQVEALAKAGMEPAK